MSATPSPTIDQQRLRAMASPLVTHHQLHAPHWDHHAPLLEGSMRMIQPQSGMYIRLADVRDRYDLLSEAELSPGIQLALVLSGQARVRFGHHRLTLGPENAGSPASQAMLVSLNEAETFRREGRAGGYERTLTITLTPEWLQRHLTSEMDRELRKRLELHLTLANWLPSPTLQALARELFEPSPASPGSLAQRLQVEGCALSLVSEALTAVHAADGPACARPSAYESRRLKRLREMIDSGEAERLTQGELAERLSMSHSSLQRQFRAHFGISLGRYLRQHRLNAARYALCHDRISVETAAALAGYTSAANFATAFKRQFGENPSACRRAG
ncbi:helix-turn-helix transcriptional regulator [Halomonas sp. WWR20]